MKEMIWGFTGKPATLEDLKACVGKGWGNLIEELVNEFFLIGWNGVVMQVKEKFGGLRFYIGSATEDIYDVEFKYEEKSFHICEECGEVGKLRGGSWLLTLCDKHEEKLKRKD